MKRQLLGGSSSTKKGVKKVTACMLVAILVFSFFSPLSALAEEAIYPTEENSNAVDVVEGDIKVEETGLEEIEDISDFSEDSQYESTTFANPLAIETADQTAQFEEKAGIFNVPGDDYSNLGEALANSPAGSTINIVNSQSISYADFDKAMGKDLTLNGNGNTVTVVDQKKVNSSNCGIHVCNKTIINNVVFVSTVPSDYFITVSSGAEGSELNNVTVASIASGGMSSAIHVRDVENIYITNFTVESGVMTSDENIGCVTISGSNNCRIDGLNILSTRPGIRFETNPKNNSVTFSNVNIPNSSAPVTSASSSILNNGSSVHLVEEYKIGLDLLNSGSFSPTVFFKTVEDVFTMHNRFSASSFEGRMNASISDVTDTSSSRVFYAFDLRNGDGNTVMLNNRDIPSGSIVKLIAVGGTGSFEHDIKFNNSREITIQAVLLDDLEAQGKQIKFNGSEIVNTASANNTTLQNFDLTSLEMRQSEFEASTGFVALEGETNTTNKFNFSTTYLSGTDDVVSGMPDHERYWYAKDESVSIVDCEPVRENHTFIGWLCSYDNNVYEAGRQNVFAMPVEDVVFTAQWERVPDPIVPPVIVDPDPTVPPVVVDPDPDPVQPPAVVDPDPDPVQPPAVVEPEPNPTPSAVVDPEPEVEVESETVTTPAKVLPPEQVVAKAEMVESVLPEVIGTVENVATPFEQLIEEEKTPLAVSNAAICWMHWYMLLGMVTFSLYATGVVVRRLRFSGELLTYEGNIVGERPSRLAFDKKPASLGSTL